MGQIGVYTVEAELDVLGDFVGASVAVVRAETLACEVRDDRQNDLAEQRLLEGAVHRRDTCDEVVAVEAVVVDGILDCLGELVLARFFCKHSFMSFEVELMGDATPFYTAAKVPYERYKTRVIAVLQRSEERRNADAPCPWRP